MDKEKKKFLRKKLSLIGLKMFHIICTKISLNKNYWLGNIMGKISYLIIRRHRRIALSNLAIAFPRMEEIKRQKIAKESFIFMIQSLLESLHSVNHLSMLRDICIKGKEYLDEALEKKKGVIAFTAHLGNFPLMISKLVNLGYPVWLMVRPMRDNKVDNYFHQLRSSLGIRTIFSYPRRASIQQTLKVLRNNGIVIILMDQNFGTGGVWIKFFGRLAATPIGPIILALRTGASILPVYTVREGLGKHTINILPPYQMIIRENKNETAIRNVARCTGLIENWIRKYPPQWSWIHRRWKSRPRSEEHTSELQSH